MEREDMIKRDLRDISTNSQGVELIWNLTQTVKIYTYLLFDCTVISGYISWIKASAIS